MDTDKKYNVEKNCVVELDFRSSREYKNPFNEIELDGLFTGPDGKTVKIPAFWAGGDLWKIRYASPVKGMHKFLTECSDSQNNGLHSKSGKIDIAEYTGNNKIIKHGPIIVSDNKKYFQHEDGEPFFWLGDTEWYSFIKDFIWPDEFKEMVADRVEKGFNLMHLIVGYLPGWPENDLGGGNEGGLPWSEGYEMINPGYFDHTDVRIEYILQNEIVPCIFGSWGYWLLRLGTDNMKKHWRYLIARYGAYPVIWSSCGEIALNYPDTKIGKTENEILQDHEKLIVEWSKITEHIKEIDPYKRPLTAHTSGGKSSADVLIGDSYIDFLMAQTGHQFNSIPNMLKVIKKMRSHKPEMPFLVGECLYEGIMGHAWQDVQRFAIWVSVLNGAAGHTYGAGDGGWQRLHEGTESIEPTSGNWMSFTDWREVLKLEGSGQMQFCKKLMEKYSWWEFEPHPEWLDIRDNVLYDTFDAPIYVGEYLGRKDNDCFIPHAAGIKDKVRIIYLPSKSYSTGILSAVLDLDNNKSYRAFVYDPRNGKEIDLEISEIKNGRWESPFFSKYRMDYVIVIENLE